MADKSEEPKTEKASILATSSSRKTKDPATTTTATKAKVESQRVSFRQEINDAEGFVVTGKKATRSARVGKADPVRDAGIFLAIIAIFYVVAQSLSGVGQPPPDGEMVEELKSGGSNRSGSKIKRMREAMAKLLEAKVKDTINPPRDLEKDPCLVWLTSSSVPHSGWGLYAGQNYTAGQEIVSGYKWEARVAV